MSPIQTMLAAALAGVLVTSTSFAANQTVLEPASTPSTVQDELLQMADHAAVIFSGEVLSVTPHESFTPGTGFVEIIFRIDQAILGCGGQTTYTLHEWSGLWTSGQPRYFAGQRLLVLLHAPSISGLSSPVGGQSGVIPITGAGIAPKPTDSTIAQNEPSVDLRWVKARLPRAGALLQSTRTHSLAITSTFTGREQAPLITRKITAPGILRSTTPSASATASPNTLPLTDSKGITLRSILAILGAWQAQQTDAAH